MGVALFSAIVNLLMLAGPIYMLQIYDRVLASRNVPTLVALTIFLVGAYAFQGVLDLIRSRIVVRAAAILDSRLGDTVHRAVIAIGARGGNAAEAHQPVRDLDTIRSFMTGAGPIAIVDMPWIPFFLAICFLIHPWIGFLSLAGAIILVAMTVQTERASRGHARAINENGGLRTTMAEADRRNVASAVSMGMSGALAARWAKVNDRHVESVGRSSDVVNSFGSITKVLRLLMQSAILGLGAYLVIRQEMTAGAMIAASIMMGRALAPIEVAIGNWRGFVAARDSVRRLSGILSRLPGDRDVTDLPKPTDSLSVEYVTVAAAERHERDPDQRSLPAVGRRCARRDRAEWVRQELALARHPGNLAAGAGHASASTARPSSSGIPTRSAAISATCRRWSSCSRARSPRTSRGWRPSPTAPQCCAPRRRRARTT